MVGDGRGSVWEGKGNLDVEVLILILILIFWLVVVCNVCVCVCSDGRREMGRSRVGKSESNLDVHFISGLSVWLGFVATCGEEGGWAKNEKQHPGSKSANLKSPENSPKFGSLNITSAQKRV
jgi:hypothetical protein